jgi:hypothetical protein
MTDKKKDAAEQEHCRSLAEQIFKKTTHPDEPIGPSTQKTLIENLCQLSSGSLKFILLGVNMRMYATTPIDELRARRKINGAHVDGLDDFMRR